ncbi:ubiquitin-conjugating enzyme E2 G1 [Plutella xylostella]|uniref:Ubiquitin-conjugating enzyme E2 G1 n=1 Tax=Plutella xylostella TaxID=51655 RepID=A0ABQ7QHN1_PLUXY|nr:ubiquitin-conjugating enzyme E2 G1 [Plutella xylostella]
MSEPQSSLLLKKQLAELNKNPVEGFSAGLIDDNDIYRWEVLIIGPPDTLYEGGFFKAHLHFPKEYPLRPPRMKFVTEIWHPNIEKNGDVCISILHEPGDDKWGYEKASERWLPVHTVETILISVISMLADPNDESPANVDAANGESDTRISKRKWQDVLGKVRKIVFRDARASRSLYSVGEGHTSISAIMSTPAVATTPEHTAPLHTSMCAHYVSFCRKNGENLIRSLNEK